LNGRFLGVIGLTAGLCYASLSSIQRLVGLEENSSEVKRFGALSNEELIARKAKADIPNIVLIDRSYPPNH
jgi:hypothetical protein